MLGLGVQEAPSTNMKVMSKITTTTLPATVVVPYVTELQNGRNSVIFVTLNVIQDTEFNSLPGSYSLYHL